MPRLVTMFLVLGVSLSALAALSATQARPIGPPAVEQLRPVAMSDARTAGEITLPLLVVQWALWLGYRRAVVLYRRMRPTEAHRSVAPVAAVVKSDICGLAQGDMGGPARP